MLIKHQFRALGDLIKEFGLKVTVTLVRTQKNKAHGLTRVKTAWLSEEKDMALVCCAVEHLKDLHKKHHFGKKWTLYLVRKVNPHIAMQDVVEECRNVN